MELLFKESFARDLKAVKQKSILPRIREVIDGVIKAKDLQSIPNLRKLNDPGITTGSGSETIGWASRLRRTK